MNTNPKPPSQPKPTTTVPRPLRVRSGIRAGRITYTDVVNSKEYTDDWSTAV